MSLRAAVTTRCYAENSHFKCLELQEQCACELCAMCWTESERQRTRRRKSCRRKFKIMFWPFKIIQLRYNVFKAFIDGLRCKLLLSQTTFFHHNSLKPIPNKMTTTTTKNKTIINIHTKQNRINTHCIFMHKWNIFAHRYIIRQFNLWTVAFGLCLLVSDIHQKLVDDEQ